MLSEGNVILDFSVLYLMAKNCLTRETKTKLTSVEGSLMLAKISIKDILYMQIVWEECFLFVYFFLFLKMAVEVRRKQASWISVCQRKCENLQIGVGLGKINSGVNGKFPSDSFPHFALFTRSSKSVK